MNGYVVTVLSLSCNCAYSQFQFIPGGQGGRTFPFVQAIGIGNFPNLASVQSVLHVNSNLTNIPTFIDRGEVFRTDAPANTAANFINAWRMRKAGTEIGMFFNWGFNPIVADRNNFS